MLSALTQSIKDFAGWHARTRRLGSTTLANFAYRYYRTFHASGDYNPARNGEYWLLAALAKFDPAVIFDIGANRGDWSVRVLSTLSRAKVHAFEVAPPVARELAKRFEGDHRIIVNQFGLSDSSRREKLEFHPTQSDVSTLVRLSRPVYPSAAEIVDVKLVIAQEYSAAFDRIDFVKTDCEGHDLQVLKGFGTDIRKISVIQFELNEFSFLQGIKRRDFYELLEGFEIGRLTPIGVVFRESADGHDAFLPGNYVAVSKTRRDIIDAVRWRHGDESPGGSPHPRASLPNRTE